MAMSQKTRATLARVKTAAQKRDTMEQIAAVTAATVMGGAKRSGAKLPTIPSLTPEASLGLVALAGTIFRIGSPTMQSVMSGVATSMLSITAYALASKGTMSAGYEGGDFATDEAMDESEVAFA